MKARGVAETDCGEEGGPNIVYRPGQSDLTAKTDDITSRTPVKATPLHVWSI
jgi:hypothetical protein